MWLNASSLRSWLEHWPGSLSGGRTLTGRPKEMRHCDIPGTHGPGCSPVGTATHSCTPLVPRPQGPGQLSAGTGRSSPKGPGNLSAGQLGHELHTLHCFPPSTAGGHWVDRGAQDSDSNSTIFVILRNLLNLTETYSPPAPKTWEF